VPGRVSVPAILVLVGIGKPCPAPDTEKHDLHDLVACKHRSRHSSLFSSTFNTHDIADMRACHKAALLAGLQWLLVVASINVEYPRAIAAPFSAVAWLFATGSTATGLDCLLTQRDSRVTVAVQKVLLGLLMPVLVLGVLVVLDAIIPYVRRWLGTRHRSRWRQRQRQSGVYARTTIVLVFFFLPSLLRTAYGMFACVRLDRKPAVELTGTFFRFNAIGSFWLMDTSQRCFEGVHRGWAAGLGVPLLILLCGVVPFGIMFFLWYRRSELQASYYQEHYGFLYKSYNSRLCFWEGVVAFQVSLNRPGASGLRACRLYFATGVTHTLRNMLFYPGLQWTQSLTHFPVVPVTDAFRRGLVVGLGQTLLTLLALLLVLLPLPSLLLLLLLSLCAVSDMCGGCHQCVWCNFGCRVPVHPSDCGIWCVFAALGSIQTLFPPCSQHCRHSGVCLLAGKRAGCIGD